MKQYLSPAVGPDLDWCREMVARHHYLRKAPDPRSRPFCYLVRVGRQRAGCLWFGRTESTCCYAGGLTYGSRDDVHTGRATWDRWEVLNLSRLWLSPDVQAGGPMCTPRRLPGFYDRLGTWRSAFASAVIGEALGRVGYDYLLAYPPVFLGQPYRVRVVLSYCDTGKHKGTVYRAAGFRLARVNERGMETWWTDAVADLTADQDAAVRRASARCPRAARIREATWVPLFEGVS